MPDERGRAQGDTLPDEHEPTERVPAIPPAGDTLPDEHEPTEQVLAVPPAAPPDVHAPRPPAADEPERPVFVSMKPQEAPADRTELVPAIERPDMRPRLRPVSELPLRHPTPIPLGNYAPPRIQARRSWLWLYVILAMAAALAGAGIALWIRATW